MPEPSPLLGQSESVARGDLVQVFNPGPMDVGRVMSDPERDSSGHFWVRVAWEGGGGSWSRCDLLRRVDG